MPPLMATFVCTQHEAVSAENDPSIRGIPLPPLPSQNIAANARDLLFFHCTITCHATEPSKSVFDEFGRLSHLKINVQKSVALNVSLSA